MKITTRKKINRLLAKDNKKSCSTCNAILPIESFGIHKDNRKASGHTITTNCRPCEVIRRTNLLNAVILKELLTK